MKNILILGGNGFIGSNLAEFFVNQGCNIIVFDKVRSEYQNLNSIKNKIKIIGGDFNDSEIIEKIFNENNIDIVIHLISTILPATPFDEITKNTEIISTIRLLDIMHKKGVAKLVFFSSGGAIYGMNGEKNNKEESPTKPINFYGWLKLALEEYIQMHHRMHGSNYIILRVSNLYGKKQNTHGNQGLIAVTLGKLLRNEQIEIWGDGKIIRDYININDCCQALHLLIENNKWDDIYNVGSGKGTSVNEILEIIKKISGIDFPVTYQETRKIDIPVNVLDISKLTNSISWQISVGLEEGIKKYWEELNRQSKK